MLGRVDKERVKNIVLTDLKRANNFYESTVEPKLLDRRGIYLASKQYYEKKFPLLSKKSDYRSYDFYALVQWAKGLISDSFFGNSRVVSVVGCQREDEKAARIMDDLIVWQIEHQSDGFSIFNNWIEAGLVYEFGIVKVWWQRSSETNEYIETIRYDNLQSYLGDANKQILDIGEPDIFGDVEIRYTATAITENKPCYDNVSPFDMRWSPEARSLDTANFVAQRQFVSASELKQGIERNSYEKKAVYEAIEKAGAIKTTSADHILNPELDNIGQEEDESRRLIELYECYVNIDADGDGILEKMIVTVANNTIVRITENSFEQIPFFKLAVHNDASKVFTDELSYADVEGEVQNVNTAVVRQLLANLALSNNPRKYVDTTIINMNDMLSDRVFVRVNGNPSSAVVPEQPTQIASWTMQFIEAVKAKEEEWTGRTRYNQGMSSDTLNKTATGIQAIMSASAQRVNSIIKIFAETGFKKFMQFQIKLNQKYMDQRQMIRVFNQPMIIAPDDIHGNLDILVDADVGLGKKLNTINALKSYLTQGVQYCMQLGLIDKYNFRKALIEVLDLSGLKNADNYFKSEEEIKQADQQQQRFQQQVQIQQQAQKQKQVQNMQALAQADSGRELVGGVNGAAGVDTRKLNSGMFRQNQ